MYRHFTRLGKYDKMEGPGAAKVVNESTEVTDDSNEKTEKGYERVDFTEKS